MTPAPAHLDFNARMFDLSLAQLMLPAPLSVIKLTPMGPNSDTPDNGEKQLVSITFNGSRFARKASRYCEQQHLAFRWRSNRVLPPRLSITTFEVAGTAEELREFVTWGDSHYSHPGFADNFEGDPFMGPDGG